MTKFCPPLIGIAAIATIYAAFAFIGGLYDDFTTAAIIAAVCLFAVIALDVVEHERRHRMRQYRADVWARRDDEAGL